MRKQSHPSLGDVPEDLPVCDGACFPGGGLCCPDDPLDLVLKFLVAPAPAPHQVSLAALGIGGSPRRQEQTGPYAPAGGGGGGGGGVLERDSCSLSLRIPQDIEPLDVVEIEKFFADNPPDGGEATAVCDPSRDTAGMPAAMPSYGVHSANGAPPPHPYGTPHQPVLHPYTAPPSYPGVGVLHPYTTPPSYTTPPLTPPMSAGVYACPAFGSFPSSDAPALPAPMPAGGGLHACVDAPPLRAHAPPSARTLPASRTSSGSMTSEAESPAPAWQPRPWGVLALRKRRRSPLNCHKRPWSVDFPLHALPVAPPDNPGDTDVNLDGKNSCHNAVGGGIRRRRPVPRQRNRQAQRVCSHCKSPDTPQWRAGPDGPGTLCNACGIRYAAHKLLPEYRPSTAPSFRSDQHSNRHRKVVKLREQKAKETLNAVPNPVLAPASPKSDEFMDVCTYISTG